MSNELLIKDTGVIAKAELDVQITTAKAYPRNPQRALELAFQLATMDEATAQSCFYCLPRKDKETGKNKEIRGASIRFAEIVANAWGNLHAATRIVENDGKHVTAEGVAWDLESNVRMAMQNKVSIWFGEDKAKGKVGYQASNDMQTMLSNAASAKALRNAIFKVVPKAPFDAILAKVMQFSIGDQKTINAKVGDLVDKLTKMGIDKQLMLDYYGIDNIGQINSEIFQSLIGVGTAIKEGFIKIDEVFKADEIEDKSMSATEKINTLIHFKKQVNAETGEVNE